MHSKSTHLSLFFQARYRQACWPCGAKDDPQDAELALDLMLRYPRQIKAIEADNPDK